MPLINCTHCGQPYDIPVEQWPLYQGRQITCTRCNRPFAVAGPPGPPAPPVAPAAAAQPPYGAAPYGAAPYAGYTAYPGPAAPPKQGMSGGKIALLVGGIVLAVLLVCAGLPMLIIAPALGRARAAAQQVKCASNLKQIGLAMLIYKNEEVRTGMFPNRLDVLAYSPADPSRTADLSGGVFVCPSDTQNTASAATGQQLAADLQAGGHCSYVYFFENRNQKKYNLNAYNLVVMYEPLSNHHDAGAEFLFADGRVDFVKRDAAAAMIRDLENGINPPTATPGGTGP